MKEPRVSILIPTYNRAWHIAQTIDSALAQSYSDIEVIVVDDASVDATAQRIQAIADPRLKYVRQARNVGMVANWGACLARARSEFVVFLSDDDLLRPEFIAHRLPWLREDPLVNVVFSRYDVQDRDGSLLHTCGGETPESGVLEGAGLLEAAVSRQWFVGAALYRRESVARLWPQLAEDNLVLDFGLNVRLAMAGGRGIYISDNDFIMMAHEGQNSQAQRARAMQESEETLLRILGENPSRAYATRLRRELANWNVVWGRLLFAEGQAQAGRARFVRALRWYPTLAWGWRQLLVSWAAPRHLRKGSRNVESAATSVREHT